jgi:acyl-CoA thioesterase-2
VPEGRYPHSFHCYFLRSGRVDVPARFHVERLRDGRSFDARLVVARQDGDALFVLTTNFQVEEISPEYAIPMPEEVLGPESAEVLAETESNPLGSDTSSFELRSVPGPVRAPNGEYRSALRVWARARTPLGDDRLVHMCELAFVSDMRTGSATMVPLGGRLGDVQMASLDHALWYHRPVAADDWMLIDFRPLSNGSARGLVTGTIHGRDGAHAASFNQELLTRPRSPQR